MKSSNNSFGKEGAAGLTKPEFMEEAARESKGWPWFIEIIIFFLVYKLFLWANRMVYVGGVMLVKSMGMTSATAPGWVMELLKNLPFAGGALCVFIYCRLLERRKLRTMGFVKKNCVRDMLSGMAIGFMCFSVCILIAFLLGAVQFTGWGSDASWWMLGLILLSYIVQGSAEEILVRGYFMVSLSRRQSVRVSVIISALAFALLHLGNTGAGSLMIVNIILISILFAVMILRRGSIWMACGFHAMWNFTQGNVFGMAVSGAKPNGGAILNFITEPGHQLISGGDFGLEAGLGTTAVFLLMVLLLLKLSSRGRD